MGKIKGESPGVSGNSLTDARGTQALAKIAVLLRSLDDRVATLKHEASPGRLLTSPEGVEVVAALAPIEEALALAVARLGLQPETADLRRRLLGPLHIMWADIVDMAPEYLETRWGAHDVPEEWGQLRLRLLGAVEEAISSLTPENRRSEAAP